MALNYYALILSGNQNLNSMKRNSVILTGIFLLSLLTTFKSFAQSDDVYYDPGNDKGQNYQQPAQRYDDGGSDNYRLKGSKTYVDSNGNTYITNNYYEDNYYSSQLERFYRPYCGMGYYDYAYTPSFYWGWGGGLGFGYSPFYSSYYGSYWGWDLGWGLGGYYNPWYSPFGYYSWGFPYHHCGYWGYGGYGYAYGYGRGYYGRGYGFEGGYYGNRYYGYAPTNNYYYFGPNSHKNLVAVSGTNNAHYNTASAKFGEPVSRNGSMVAHNGEIPREGIATPRDANRFSSNASEHMSRKEARAGRANDESGWHAVEPKEWKGNNSAINNSNNIDRGTRRANRAPNPQYNNNQSRPELAPQQRNYSSAPPREYGGRQSAPSAPSYRGGGQAPSGQRSAPSPQFQSHSYSAPSYHGGGGGGSFHSSSGGGGFHGGGGGGSHGGGGRH